MSTVGRTYADNGGTERTAVMENRTIGAVTGDVQGMRQIGGRLSLSGGATGNVFDGVSVVGYSSAIDVDGYEDLLLKFESSRNDRVVKVRVWRIDDNGTGYVPGDQYTLVNIGHAGVASVPTLKTGYHHKEALVVPTWGAKQIKVELVTVGAGNAVSCWSQAR